MAMVKNILLCFCAFSLTGCIPVVRDEYLSPNWQGTLINKGNGAPVVGALLIDRVSSIQSVSGNQGEFHLDAKIRSFDFKLPAASMAQYFVLEIEYQNFQLYLVKLANAVHLKPWQLEVGNLLMDSEWQIQDFEARQNQTAMTLTKQDIERCGAPLKSAVYLTEQARWLTHINSTHRFSDRKSELINQHYLWAVEVMEFAATRCFRDDFAMIKKLNAVASAIYSEARPYLKSI